MTRIHLAVALLGCASRAVGVALEGAAARVDTACRAAIGASPRQAYDRLLPAFGALECFGASTRCALPVPLLPLTEVSTAEVESITKMPINAFMPSARARGKRRGEEVATAAGALTTQLLLTVAILQGRLQLSSLRELEGWQLPPLLLGVMGATVLVVWGLDRFVLRGRQVLAQVLAHKFSHTSSRTQVLAHKFSHEFSHAHTHAAHSRLLLWRPPFVEAPFYHYLWRPHLWTHSLLTLEFALCGARFWSAFVEPHFFLHSSVWSPFAFPPLFSPLRALPHEVAPPAPPPPHAQPTHERGALQSEEKRSARPP